MSNNIIAQRTAEWRAQRKLRLTGSRIGAILGQSPWQKPDDVIREMVREYHDQPSEFVTNPAVEHGNNNEQRALLCFMRKTGLQVDECGFFEYGDRMGASPDGLTSDGGVLELKVPFGLRNQQEAQFKTLADQPHYHSQVMMEMLSAGRNHAYFAQYVAPKGDPLGFDYVPEQMSIERVELDQSWIDTVLPELDAFYKQLLAELDNQEHLEPLRAVIDTPDAGILLAEIDRIKAELKELAEQEKATLEKIVALADGKDALVHGRKLTLVKRAGSISYAKAIAELVPDADLEKWRGKPSSSWRLS